MGVSRATSTDTDGYVATDYKSEAGDITYKILEVTSLLLLL